MKYFKRLKVYKNYNGNNYYDPEKQEAYSYKWWRYLQVIEGVLVFNNYSYSPATSSHQSALKSILDNKGYTTIYTHASLNGISSIKNYINILTEEVAALDEKIRSPRTQKRKNLDRAKSMLATINRAKKILKTFKLEKEFKKELDNSIELYNNVLVHLNGEVYAAIYKVG